MRLPALAGGLALGVLVVVALLAARAEDRADRSEVRAEQSAVAAERTVTLLEAQAELQRPSHAVEAMMYATRPASVPAVAGIGRPPRGRGAAHAAWTRCSDAYVRGALDEAEVLCEQAKASDATYPPIYNTLGRIHADRGERDAAERLYEQALAHDPNYVPALLGLSTCKALRRDLDGAEQAVLRALELAPENERAGRLAARIRNLQSRVRG
jgi:tetratricopeptide (TPR) repeat protein